MTLVIEVRKAKDNMWPIPFRKAEGRPLLKYDWSMTLETTCQSTELDCHGVLCDQFVYIGELQGRGFQYRKISYGRIIREAALMARAGSICLGGGPFGRGKAGTGRNANHAEAECTAAAIALTILHGDAQFICSLPNVLEYW